MKQLRNKKKWIEDYENAMQLTKRLLREVGVENASEQKIAAGA